jgi:Invasin, domain 3
LRFVNALAASLFLISGAACGGGDLVLPQDQPPAEIVVVDGNEQEGTVGTELAEPLVARVVDAEDQPVSNVGVAFRLGDGADGGGLSPDTTFTNADGLASSHWVLGGTSGRQEVEAEVVGATLTVTFSALAERISGLRLELTSGDEQGAEPGAALADPLVVRLVDDAGDGVPGRAVAWVVATGEGAATPPSSDTDAEGYASTTWTLGPESGTQTLNAVVSGVGVVSFTATADGDGGGGPSPDLSTVTASPASIDAGTGLSTITVTVRDGDGAAVSGAIVALSATGSGNILTQPSAPTGADGVATGTLQSVLPGTKVVSAVVNGSVAIAATATVTVTVIPGANHLAFLVQPSDVQEDEEISPAVEVAIVDPLGILVPVSDVEIEIELIKEDGHDSKELEGERTRETEDGIAVFPDLVVKKHEDNYRLRASAPDLPELGSVESAFFNVED